ncbi:MAG: hypothetical protein CMJ49_12945 [Planctomycetaceae bacterium]|nr:hypothetical protein [Planctomycetaceae bacterium]
MTKILIIDDMAVFREPIAVSLRAQGYQVACAENGRQALDVVQEEHPDLILLDMAMPVTDGLAFLEAGKRLPGINQIPVILLTAVSEKDYIIKAGQYGVRDYLLKSQFALTELYARIEKRLQNPHPIAAAHQTAQPTATATAAPNTATTLKDIKPIITRAQIDEQLDEAGELKAMSPSVGQIMKMTANPNCAIEAVAKIVKQDQAISLKVLKIANSGVYSRGQPVDTIINAVMRIGLAQIRQLVMNIAVVDRFSLTHKRMAQWFNTQLYWEHSIGTGLIAANMTHRIDGNDDDVDAAFTTGLLHDIGRMVFIEQFPEQYAQILETAHTLQLPLERVERRMLRVNHADIMDKLLHRWKFAKQLVHPVALHHLSAANIRGAAPKWVQEVSILALANRLAHALLLGASGNEAIYPTHELASLLGLHGEDITQVITGVVEDTDDLKLVMLNADNTQPWPSTIDQFNGAIDVPLRPIFIGLDPQIDAFGIFCRMLNPPDDQTPPNAAIVHLRSQKNRAELTSQLMMIESEPDAQRLPLIIMSPKGEWKLETAAMADRPAVLLPTPTPLARIQAAANKILAAQDTVIEQSVA